MNRTSIILLIACAGFAAVFLKFAEIDCITVRLPDKNNELIHLIPANAGDRFSLMYNHSVEKTLVKGIFQVSENHTMLAVETRMTSVGTGLPNTFSGRTARDGKWIVVDEEMRELEPFRFFIARVNKTFLLTPKENKIDLMTLPPGTVILLGVERLAMARYFFKR